MPPSGILGRVARSADAPRTGRFGRASLFIDGSGQVTSLTFAFTAPPTESQGGEVTFTNATITNPQVQLPVGVGHVRQRENAVAAGR